MDNYGLIFIDLAYYITNSKYFNYDWHNGDLYISTKFDNLPVMTIGLYKIINHLDSNLISIEMQDGISTDVFFENVYKIEKDLFNDYASSNIFHRQTKYRAYSEFMYIIEQLKLGKSPFDQ